MSLAEVGAAVLILEEDLSAESLIQTVEELTKNKEKLREMGISAKRCHVQDALPKIYHKIEKLLE